MCFFLKERKKENKSVGSRDQKEYYYSEGKKKVWSETYPLASRYVISPGEGHSNPLQYACLENPMDRGACRATVHGVTKSRTWLKRLSTHATANAHETHRKKEAHGGHSEGCSWMGEQPS